jgi:hypothetical protein
MPLSWGRRVQSMNLQSAFNIHFNIIISCAPRLFKFLFPLPYQNFAYSLFYFMPASYPTHLIRLVNVKFKVEYKFILWMVIFLSKFSLSRSKFCKRLKWKFMFRNYLLLSFSSALCNTAAARVYQLEYSRFVFNSSSQFKVVIVDSLLSSATQDAASPNVIIRSYTSALCSIPN